MSSEMDTKNESKELALVNGDSKPKANGKMETPKKNEGSTKTKKDAKEKKIPVKNNMQEGAQKSQKSMTKAERRAKQEAQRAAKEALKAGKANGPKPKEKEVRVPVKVNAPAAAQKVNGHSDGQQAPAEEDSKVVTLFKHLYYYENTNMAEQLSHTSPAMNIHPIFIKLGSALANGKIIGSNARCVALMQAIKEVISVYVTPEHKEISRDLYSKLKPNLRYIKQCRPMSVSMNHALKFLKKKISEIPSDIKEEVAKDQLLKDIDGYVRANLLLAAQRITELATEKINDNDVIMVYAGSSLITRALILAHKKGTKFKVVVADSSPKCRGRTMLDTLFSAGIKCCYGLINSVTIMMQQEKVTKLFIGAHAVFGNGGVMSRVGTAQCALVAESLSIPVLVFCETYKFSSRMQTDSVVYNEVGNPDELLLGVEDSPLINWRKMKNVALLNLQYDVTSSDLITLLITELSIMPPASAPVVLRMKQM